MKRVIHASHYSELTYDQAILFFFFCALYFLDMEANTMFKTKSK